MLKVTVCRESDQQKYPRLKIFTKLSQVVLFTRPFTGTVIDPGQSPYSRGEHSCSWVENAFEDFFGSVTLSETKGNAE